MPCLYSSLTSLNRVCGIRSLTVAAPNPPLLCRAPYTAVVEHIKASQFKQQCLAILDNLRPEGIVITNHGKPVARLLPAASDCTELIGCLKGKIQVHGDILSTGVSWDAES